MSQRRAFVLCFLIVLAPRAWAQTPPGQWRATDRSPRVANSTPAASPAGTASAAPTPQAPATNVAPIEKLAPVGAAPQEPIAKVKEGIGGSLPSEQGQVWREYDITPYTQRISNTKKPEQAIVDWIFRETGYEIWHSDGVAVLAADNRSLRVYHTPAVHATVTDVVDRFVNTEVESHAFGVRVITVDHPSWRAKADRVLKPIPVQTPGVQAWLLAKEDATFLIAELRKQTDFREHSSPHLLVNNGQSSVVAATRPRTYVRRIVPRPEVFPGFEAEMGQIDEGFSLEFSPLLSRDHRMIDAAIKCNIDQVEKLIPVALDVPTPVSQRQRTQVDVPQQTQFRLHERFRWPAEQVLIIDAGVVPVPVPTDPGLLQMALPMSASPRANLLIFLEGKGRLGQAPTVTGATARMPDAYRGRY